MRCSIALLVLIAVAFAQQPRPKATTTGVHPNWGLVQDAAAFAEANTTASSPSTEQYPVIGPRRTDATAPPSNRYIIHIKKRVTSRGIHPLTDGNGTDVSQAIANAGGQVVRHLGSIDAVAAHLSGDAHQQLLSSDWVDFIEPDAVRRLLGQTVPYGVPQIQADSLTDPFADRRTVCIVDTGFDMNHPDLETAPVTKSSLSDTGDAFVDNQGHGTHVAGIISALNNQIGVVGVIGTNQLKLHIVKVFQDDGDFTYASSLIEAIGKCVTDGNANVVSMSLGGGDYSAAEDQAFRQHAANGVLFVAAAGNDGEETCMYPACYSGVLAVAAVDGSNKKCSFSNSNSHVELAAPGYKVLSTYPVAMGSYAHLSGTSMACPYVSGGAALVWSYFPQCSNDDVRDALRSTALDLGTPGRDHSYGYGLIQVADAKAYLATRPCAASSSR